MSLEIPVAACWTSVLAVVAMVFWRFNFVRVLLDCRSRVGRSRGSCWLSEPAVHEIAFRSIPFRGVFRSDCK